MLPSDYVHQVTKTNLAQIQDAEEQAISEEGMDEPGPRLQRFSPLDAMSMGSSADSSTVGGTVFVPPEGGEFKLPWLETIVVDHRIVKAEIN